MDEIFLGMFVLGWFMAYLSWMEWLDHRDEERRERARWEQRWR